MRYDVLPFLTKEASMFEPIDLGDFEKRTGIAVSKLPSWDKADRIVSLRDLAVIDDVRVMSFDYLGRLMESVPLVGDPSVRPYAGCRIDRYRIDPRMSKIGQTFVENAKILRLNQRDRVFDDFDVPSGVAMKGAFIVFGRTASGDEAVAHYLPPIIEHIGNRHVVLDGIHRFSYTMGAGTTLEIIKVSEPNQPLPFDPCTWERVVSVDAKPPKHERFFGLKPELYRDLKHIGIDG